MHTTSGKILASHHNTVLAQDDPTAHAEMKCVRDGAAALGTGDGDGDPTASAPAPPTGLTPPLPYP